MRWKPWRLLKPPPLRLSQKQNSKSEARFEVSEALSSLRAAVADPDEDGASETVCRFAKRDIEDPSRPLVLLLPFDAAASTQAGWLLMALSIGLLPVILQRVLYPVFFARRDTLTPMLVTLAGVGVQVALAVTLFPVIGVFGLGLSIAVAAWLHEQMALPLSSHREHYRRRVNPRLSPAKRTPWMKRQPLCRG